ncbi:hypothetical protein E0H22_15625 [Rhodopseudomonas boonkerdii]|uniref:hypothetical protein n=1 Tax=Rhodopseudomonas boonkerdii TaxID=475937 RepID=UPI001E369C9B|nr:hypothetical protein [Rhodopseudomonas boonkerdii]UGV26992.1 hypothetical protein E0H22_15625 [Rhodopseudomonas boonkerdii]
MAYASPRQREFFIGAKTHGQAVPVEGVVRDALILLSLDPDVLDIGHMNSVEVDGHRHWIDAITVTRQGGGVRLFGLANRNDDPPLKRIASLCGMDIEIVEVGQVTAEPRLASAREIWSQRHIQMPCSMRRAIARALFDDGPLTLHQLCSYVPGPREPESAVMSMLCSGEIELARALQPSDTFGGATLIRSRG